MQSPCDSSVTFAALPLLIFASKKWGGSREPATTRRSSYFPSVSLIVRFTIQPDIKVCGPSFPSPSKSPQIISGLCSLETRRGSVCLQAVLVFGAGSGSVFDSWKLTQLNTPSPGLPGFHLHHLGDNCSNSFGLHVCACVWN